MSSIVLYDGSKIAAAPIEVDEHDRRLVVASFKLFLIEFAQYIDQKHYVDIFGPYYRDIIDNHAFVGSSANLVNTNIPDAEFVLYKPTLGDIDVQVSEEYKDLIKEALNTKRTFNGYKILGTTNHGNETSVLIYDSYEGPYQVDFEYVDFANTKLNHKFLHSSSWEDTRHGIKGLYHKLLLNAIGLDHYKFSVTHGLRYRDSSLGTEGIGTAAEIGNIFFGLKKNDPDIVKMNSFIGLCELISEYIAGDSEDTAEQIYRKFEKDVGTKSRHDSTDALDYLREKIGLYE